MKKIILAMLLLVAAHCSYGQDDRVRDAAELKTGNSQDVLASFFRLGFNDLWNGRQFQFSSSILAIKAKTNPNILVDTNYQRQKFARNMVIGIGLMADSSFKFRSALLHAKYAIINNRDKDLFKVSPELETLFFVTNTFFHKAMNEYQSTHPLDSDLKLVQLFKTPASDGKRTPSANLPMAYKRILNTLLQSPEFTQLSQLALDDIPKNLDKRYAAISKSMEKASLWTVGGQYIVSNGRLFNKAVLNTEYLKGVTKTGKRMGLELDINANLSFYDSLAVVGTYRRTVLNSSAGINWIIYKSRQTEKSYVEFKPALTYYNVFGGLLPDENKSKFTFDGVLRVRITDELWLPLNIKYDPNAKKIFGFLNVTANFDWLGHKNNN